MKKLLLLPASAILSFNAHGEWVKTFEWDNGDIAYTDLDTRNSNNAGLVTYPNLTFV